MYNIKKPEDYVSQKIKRASEDGVLLYKTNRPDHPATWEQIVGAPGVREESFYELEFIVKDEDGNVTEMWFNNVNVKENGKTKRNDFRKDKGKKSRGR